MSQLTYAEKLKSPLWQKKRLEIMERAGFACEGCGSRTETLHVHHGYYERSLEPWEYDGLTLWCLCESCHVLAQEALRDVQFEIAHLNPTRLSPAMILNLSDEQDLVDFERRRDDYRLRYFHDRNRAD